MKIFQKHVIKFLLIASLVVAGCSSSTESGKIYFSHASSTLPAPEMDKTLSNQLQLEVYFANDDDTLDRLQQQRLQELGLLLIANPVNQLVIDGHTDSNASASYNNALSHRRAVYVKNYLKNLGVKAEQISLSYFGENMPQATNTTPRGRALNRRSLITVVLKQQD